MKTENGIYVVYYNPTTQKTFQKGFLYSPKADVVAQGELPSKWQPIGLATTALMIPFDTVKINWYAAKEQLGNTTPNCTEVLLALNQHFREDFDHCAEILGKPKLADAVIPLATYPEGFNLHPIHRARFAPFFFPEILNAGYRERALPWLMRLAVRM